MAFAIVITLPIPLVAQSDSTKRDDGGLEQCDRPFGTLAIVEPDNAIILALTRYNLTSPTGVIRTIAQRSRCFIVLERGAAMDNMMRERELSRKGGLEPGSNVGDGQMKAADFVLTPSVLFSENNGGGVGGMVGSLFSRVPIVGALGAGMKFKEAQTSMLVADVRSGVQIISAEGKATKRDFSFGGIGIGDGMLAGAGAYTNTNEGKVIVASFVDNFNKVVIAFRADSSLRKRAVITQSGETRGNGAQAPQWTEGDVLRPKLNNIRILGDSKESARSIGVIPKGEDVVYLGLERNGFVRVQTSEQEGWVKKTLMAKK